MDEIERCAFLRSVAPFGDWSDCRIESVAAACCELEVGTGAAFGEADSSKQDLFIIVAGRVSVERPNRSRQVLGPGDVGDDCAGILTALEPTVVLNVSRIEFERIEREG